MLADVAWGVPQKIEFTAQAELTCYHGVGPAPSIRIWLRSDESMAYSRRPRWTVTVNCPAENGSVGLAAQRDSWTLQAPRCLRKAGAMA